MATLQLTVPTIAHVENPNTITSPDELREWMDELPIANPLLTAENLLLSLQLLNRHPGALSELPELLSLYLHMFGDLLDLLRSGTGKPSAVGRRARADLDETVQQINKEVMQRQNIDFLVLVWAFIRDTKIKKIK
ncbi:MAG: hypothetical protein B0D87_05710, partial [Candidatus Sedimenticola endophacoides]